MKIILLLLFLFVPAPAQYKENSVCLRIEDGIRDPILSICNTGTGMTGLPRVRLYLRVYADGTAAYEENDGQFKLAVRTLKVSAETVAEIKRLGGAKDFQAAKNDYPVFQIWTDSGLETTIGYNDGEKSKMITVRNYSFDDEKNYQRYPASLVTLLSLTSEIRSGKMRVPKFIAYDGRLEVGKTYRGRVNFGDAYGMRLTTTPKLPYHHSVMYSWPNVKDFPELDPDRDFGVRMITFRVRSQLITKIARNRWTTTFTLEILRVE